MRLTTKGRFAVTAILDLALNETEKPVTLADISDRNVRRVEYFRHGQLVQGSMKAEPDHQRVASLKPGRHVDGRRVAIT